jgi:hypothetical protein
MTERINTRPLVYARGSGFQLTDGHKIHLLYGSPRTQELIGQHYVWTECNQTFPFGDNPLTNPFAVIWSAERVKRMLAYPHLRNAFCKRCLKAAHALNGT